MRKILLSFFILALLVLPVSYSSGSDAEDSDAAQLLLDYGNGSYVWYDIPADHGTTYLSAAESALTANAILYTESSGTLTSVGSISNTVVGTQACTWRFFLWDSYTWAYGEEDGSEKYSGETIALYYSSSASILPVSTPYFSDSWVSYRGDSSNSGISVSEGPESAATPLEWSISSESGGVYGSILYADGLIYYITGGDREGTGVNRNPHLNCVDTVNHTLSWSFSYTLSSSHGAEQYELNSPVIVGDMIIINSSNRHIYCLDRYEGTVLSELVPKGETAHYAGVFDTYTYTYLSTASMSGSIISNGPTSAVYDSGALYFNTHDGQTRCYSVTRENGFQELWTYTPAESQRGCFYFAAPSITYVDGVRVVVSGSYAGYIYCVNADTGAEISVKKITDTGVIGKVTPAGDGKVLVEGNDGGMSPRSGFTALIDLKDMSQIWKIDLYGGSPVIMNNTVYAYLKPAVSSTLSGYDKPQVWDKNGVYSDAVSGFYALSLDDGHVIWKNESSCYTKSGLTYCDGKLYCADYSTLGDWPSGGGLRCIDPDTGSLVWAVKLEPGEYEYCMCTPTVADGKVYIGNDGGTVYCVSDTPGRIDSETADIDYKSQGLAHWSWILLFATAIATMAVAVMFYRK